jgi:hypothetical protein
MFGPVTGSVAFGLGLTLRLGLADTLWVTEGAGELLADALTEGLADLETDGQGFGWVRVLGALDGTQDGVVADAGLIRSAVKNAPMNSPRVARVLSFTRGWIPFRGN